MNLSYRTKLLFLGGLGVVFVGSASGYYVYKFGTNVLVDHEKWGQFGDFLGGTTNPLLALLTFLGVLWTISLTHDERKNQQAQDEKDDLYRIIETINIEINNLLKEKLFSVPIILNVVFVAETYVSFADLLKMKKREVRWADIKVNYSSHLLDIAVKLGTLKYYLQQYEAISNNRIVSDFYRIHYMLTCFQLDELDLIDKETLCFYKDSQNIIVQDQIKNSVTMHTEKPQPNQAST